MIILDATTKSLEFKLGGTVTTNQMVFVSNVVDHTASAYTPVEQDGLSNNTTAVTIVSAPGASTQRSVKDIQIYNRDTVAQTVTVQYNNNATIREILVVTLAVKDSLNYLDTDGWTVIDTNGQKKSIANVSGTVTANAGTNLNTSALALDTSVSTSNTRIGDLTESAPGTDTASSGVNGRLQRIAQRLTSLIALLPSALVSGRLDVNLGAAPATVTIGAIPAGTNNIGDVDVLSIAAGTNRLGYIRPTNGIIAPEDIGTAAWVVKTKGAVVSSSGNNAFISAVASKRLRVIGTYIQAKNSVGTTNTAVKFFDTAGTPVQITDSPEFEGQAREGLRMTASQGSFLFTTASGLGIQINLSAAQSFFVHVEYMEEP